MFHLLRVIVKLLWGMLNTEWEFREVCVLRKVSYLLGRDGRDGRQGPAGPRGLTGPKGSRIPYKSKGVVRFIEFSSRVVANSSGTVEPEGSHHGGLRLLRGKSPQASYFESLVSPPLLTTPLKKYIPLPLLIPSYYHRRGFYMITIGHYRSKLKAK